MSKHTKQPWSIVRGRCGRSVEVFGGDGKAITEMWDRADEETQEANAQMMKAAPDMYEALKDLVDGIEMTKGPNGMHYWSELESRQEHARKALKKAEGVE